MILLDLNAGDSRPIYGQIADRVKFAVAAGVLRPGELVPSVRELSKQLVVNPNTVARAYRELQSEGLIEPVRGTGLQVAEGAAERCRASRSDFVRARLRAALDEARQTAARSGRDRGHPPRGMGQGERDRPRGGREGRMTTSQAKIAIRIENLTRSYRDQLAVDRLSLEIPEGSVFGLLGENGAGKTTTIQVLMGLIAADSGKVEVLGLDPARQGVEIRRRVGYVPEQPALYDWMTVGEIGWFAAGFHPDGRTGTAGYQARYAGLVDGFGLPARRKIKALSKGMRAKVSLALAMASDPALLVLDEPTSGLDALVRREFLESMVELASSGKTVLLSSHQIAEVERVASHVALLHQGRLILAEPLEEMKARTFLAALTFTSRDHPAAPPAGLPVELIDAADAPRQAHWLIRARDRAAADALRTLPGVESVRIETPSLEEIYIGYMRGRRPQPEPPRPAANVA
ncbi:MAG: ATP-binding cassette domain-containing protein [Isosphaeraceae bacterium]